MNRFPVILLLVFNFTFSQAQYFDWPVWRYDQNRSASTPEQLADKLYLQWQIKYSPRIPVWDDPLNQNLMQYDRIFEPIVAENKIFLGFNDQDKVVALDINAGEELWHFYADGPVRFPLAANKGNVYFISDDGYCYCLNASTGFLVWKRLLAPASNKILGNKRLISMWPARGGIVIKDNIIYTAASIFPMMGTFIYAINADNGEIVWKNEGSGSEYILQPHGFPSFAYVAPQGNFAISGDKLLVAGGRTVPAAYDLKTGKEIYYLLAASGKAGGAFTCCNDRVYFNHFRERMTYMYESETGKKLKSNAGEYPVIDGDIIYFSGKKIYAEILNSKNELTRKWEINVPANKDLIKAGNFLYAADSTTITAININGAKPEIIWSVKTDETIERLLASNGKLIAVTTNGSLLVYGDTECAPVSLSGCHNSILSTKSPKADNIIKTTGIKEGYAFLYGTKDIDMMTRLISETSLNIIAFDIDPLRISFLRNYFDQHGIYSNRLSFLHYDDPASLLPKYLASLTIIDDKSFITNNKSDNFEEIYESTRPYGGRIWVNIKGINKRYLTGKINNLRLHGVEIKNETAGLIISRSGSLEGSADWTHNYGNISNTIKSDDDIVKAPLGILWFGGNSNLDVLPRHGHGPSEQVIDGRLIIEGINCISARDVYTGRLLWKHEFEKLSSDSWLVYYDESYDGDSPLNTKYNQEHLPGVNARGTNFIVTREYVYVIEGNKCRLLNIESGDLVKSFETGDSTKNIGYIGVHKNYLIIGNNYSEYSKVAIPDTLKENKRLTNYDVSASKELFVLDRFSGKKLWSLTANHGFIHNSVIVGDDILFCLDKLPQNFETKLRRRGEPIPSGSRLLYIDINTGKEIYEEKENIFGTWLGYSRENRLLLQASAPSSDMLTGEKGERMIVYNVNSKEILWDKKMKYTNPPIISGDKIYTNGEGFSLFTGDPIIEKDLITGEDIKWNFKREYGCGIVIASEHLLTFRSAAAGFINLDVFEGTGNLGGFKAGCSANLIVADGVLNAPDYTRTCQCPYQNQTSLAFVNTPWMNYWTNSNYKWSGKEIKNLGINLNAPGDRVSAENVLWIDYPNIGGAASGIDVKIDSVDYFTIRKDPTSIKSEKTPWISASAIGGIRSMSIKLSNEENVPEKLYTIKLYFSEPENKKPGERVFDISIQNSKVIDKFDVVNEAGRKDKEVIKSFPGIKAGKNLKIDLIPIKGNTILSGIELIQETVALK